MSLLSVSSNPTKETAGHIIPIGYQYGFHAKIDIWKINVRYNFLFN